MDLSIYNLNFSLCSHNTDFEPRIRDKVIDYVINKFGEERVSAIGTFANLKTKFVLQDICRVLNIPASEVLSITKKVLKDVNDDDSLEQIEHKFPDFKYFLDFQESNNKNIRSHFKVLRNNCRQIGQHAAGVLISSENLFENIALIRAKKRYVTGWQEGSDYHELSDLGYYKFDVLGLNNLQVVNDSVSLIKKRRGIEVNWDDIDIDDQGAYEVACLGDNFGVFQFETALGRKILLQIKPHNFDDISACSALLRPGPLQMGMDKVFADRKNGLRKYEEVECLKDILGSTYFILVYQEQFMKIAMKIGGLDNKEVNEFRRALVKYGKSPEAEEKRKAKVKTYQQGFVESAKNFIGKDEAEKLWDLIASFASYGFNKSHSDSYSYTTFRELYLKRYFDPEFNVSLLNNTQKGKEDSSGTSVIFKYCIEIMKKNYKILPPSINDSLYEFSLLDDKTIVFGLGWIKGLSEDIIQKIVTLRPFFDFDDFVEKIGGIKSLNKRNFDSLFFSGCFDCLSNKKEIYESYYAKRKKDVNFEEEKLDLDEQQKSKINICFNDLIRDAKNKVILDNYKESLVGAKDLSYIKNSDFIGEAESLCVVKSISSEITKTQKKYFKVSLTDFEEDLLVYLWPWKFIELEKPKDRKTEINENCFYKVYLEKNDQGFVSLRKILKLNKE